MSMRFYKAITGIAIFISLFMYASHAQAALLRKAPNNLGLAGYWSFADGKGSTATDFSGQGNTGTLTNFALTGSSSNWVTGKNGKGLSFDGSDDYVSIGGDASVYGRSTNLSIFTWIKTTDTSWEAFSGGEADDCGWGLASFSSIGGTGQLTACVGGVWRTSGHTNVSDGQWHHVGYTLSSASAGTLQYYLDGAPDGSAITSAGSHNGAGSGIRMGSDSLSQFDLNGELDEARFYTRALTSAEVAALYSVSTKSSVASQSNQIRLVPTGLGGFWSFNAADISGTTAYDRAGSANGTITNGPTVTTGKFGNALSFDGNNDYVTATNNVTSNGTSRTISAWIYPNSVANSEFVSLESTVQSGGPLALFGFRSATLSVYHGGDYRTAATTLTTGRWYHAVYTYDSSSNAVRLYLNGNQDYGNTLTDAYGGSEVHIGVGYNGYFNGKIDEVRLYSRAITAAEVAELYHGGRGGLNASQSLVASNSLVNWHTFDGPKLTNTTSTDSSGQGRDGSLSGSMRKTIGKAGQAMAFRGIGETITIAGGGGLNNVSEGSITMWVKWSGTQDGAYGVYGPTLSRQNNGVFTNNIIGLDGADPSTAKVTWGFTGYSPVITGATAVGDNIWRHVVITFTSGDHKLYLDGAQDGTSATTGSTSNDSGVALTIGGWPGDGNRYIAGAIDDFRVYNRVLTPAEVLQLYSLTK